MSSPIHLRLTQTVERETVVDVPAFMAALTEKQKTEYLDLDLDRWGFSQEWERPLAYAYVCVSEGCAPQADGIPGALQPHIVSDRSDHSDDETPRIVRRGDLHTRGDNCQWVEEDFWAIADTLPWVAAILYGRDPSSAGDERRAEYEKMLALRPGPLDVPLFP